MISRAIGIQYLPPPFLLVENFQSQILKSRVFPKEWGIPHYLKNWLDHHVLHVCSKNVDFVIFMQFLTILPKMSHHTSPNQMGNSEKGESEKNECLGGCKEFICLDISLGWLIVKRDLVKKIWLWVQFQMLILVCFSQTTS